MDTIDGMSWLEDKPLRYKIMSEVIADGLAQQFKMLRIQRGMTQKQFAEFLGWQQTVVARLETVRGMRHVSLRTLCHIAHKCNIAIICRFVSWREWLKTYLPFLPIPEYSQDAIQLLITPHGVYQGAGI